MRNIKAPPLEGLGRLNSEQNAPPTSRGAPCTMVSKVTGAQECDATEVDSSTTAGLIKKNNYRKINANGLYTHDRKICSRRRMYHCL